MVDFICQYRCRSNTEFPSISISLLRTKLRRQHLGSLPTVSQVRASEWTLESYVNAGVGPTIHTGAQDDDIWKSTRSLRPGMKLKTTLKCDTKIHHWGVGYGGTTGLGNGPTNPFQVMQLVPGDLQTLWNLEQNKTSLLIIIILRYTSQKSYFRFVGKKYFLEIQLKR